MLESSEKAYCLALDALKQKDYIAAAGHFDRAAPHFRNDKEFCLFRESTRLLVDVRKRLSTLENADNRIEIEEIFSNG